MRRIAVINQKGGTGKTTTAVNLAAGLTMAGFRTLLVELDPQAHATIGIGLPPDEFPDRTISEVLVAENPRIEAFIADTYLELLKLVPSSIRLSRVASQLHSQNFREHRLAQAFERHQVPERFRGQADVPHRREGRRGVRGLIKPWPERPGAPAGSGGDAHAALAPRENGSCPCF